MRQRVEDLGRLAILLRNLLDHKLFDDEFKPARSKDYFEWFAHLSEDQRDDVLRNWIYGIEDLSDKVHEMLSIAEGTDTLNEIT